VYICCAAEVTDATLHVVGKVEVVKMFGRNNCMRVTLQLYITVSSTNI